MLSLQLYVIVGLILFMKVVVALKSAQVNVIVVPARWQRNLMLLAPMPVVFMAIVLPHYFTLWLVREGAAVLISYAWNSAHASFIAAIVAVCSPFRGSCRYCQLDALWAHYLFWLWGSGYRNGDGPCLCWPQLPLYQTLSLLVMAY